MEVGVGPHFCGFTIDLVQKGAVLCRILNMHLKMKILNSHCAGYGYFKDGTPENSDLFHCGKAVAFPNEKYNNNNKMEILGHVAISENY